MVFDAEIMNALHVGVEISMDGQAKSARVQRATENSAGHLTCAWRMQWRVGAMTETRDYVEYQEASCREGRYTG